MNKPERLTLIAQIAARVTARHQSRAVTVASLPLPADEVAVVLPSQREHDNTDEDAIDQPSRALVSQLADSEALANAHESAAHASSDILNAKERRQARAELAAYRAERRRYWLAPLSLFRPLSLSAAQQGQTS